MGIKGDKLTEEASSLCGHVVDILASLGAVTSKKMFGGYGIFENGVMFALINSNARLFFKVGDKNRQDFTNAGTSQHGKMPYFEVPDEVVDNNSLLQKWAQTAIESAHEAKK